MVSGMAYESMTTTETTTSAWPAAIEDYVRGRAFFPVTCPYSAECVEGEFGETRMQHRA
jgi:3-deoxy-D-arabino-heptulosonate 7-phosphate (DAHP) synthase